MDNQSISLFVPFYTPSEISRFEELQYCVQQNTANKNITKIFLIIDDGTEYSPVNDHLEIISVKSRPTYQDWLNLTEKHVSKGISVLANADIFFDESIIEFRKIFENDSLAFIALSRFEKISNELTAHPNPQWSQDVWAINSKLRVSDSLKHSLKIPLGTPRCDNKVAYLFSIHGHHVYNPINYVRSIHVHETNIRTYEKNTDLQILGGALWVYPSDSLLTPSKLTFDLWKLPGIEYSELRENSMFEYEKNIPKSTSSIQEDILNYKENMLVYDAHWQFPAVTEKHAFQKMEEFYFLFKGSNKIYFGFPWATYIDQKLHNKSNQDMAQLLEGILQEAKELLKPYKHIVTVCQHIHMLKFIDTFKSLGITTVFWTHAAIGQTNMPGTNISIEPFPLYPVQTKSPARKKKFLFTFIGAKSPSYYLTNSRNLILENLSDVKDACVKGRDTWHYNKVVYDHQIRGAEKESKNLVDIDTSTEFKEILSKSVFSLCPSGTGPNSIRLWESISSGVIPVVLADTYQPPGNAELWDLATITCEEDENSIKALPDRLRKIHKDQNLLVKKRHALKQLKLLYGKDYFVYDVLKMMISNTTNNELVELKSKIEVEGFNQKFHSLAFDSKGKYDKIKLLKLNTFMIKNIQKTRELLSTLDQSTKYDLKQKYIENGLSTDILERIGGLND